MNRAEAAPQQHQEHSSLGAPCLILAAEASAAGRATLRRVRGGVVDGRAGGGGDRAREGGAGGAGAEPGGGGAAHPRPDGVQHGPPQAGGHVLLAVAEE